MKHFRYWSLTALTGLLILLPTHACGPDFPSAVFVLAAAPDGDYARFAAGHLGVLQPGFHSRSLAIAYRILTGPPLTPEEQQQAVAANKFFVSPDNGYTDGKPDPPPPGFDAWIKARDRFGPVDGFSPGGALPNGITIDYEAIPNCLDPAFATAAATLAARAQQHGPHDPTVTEWVRGQDVVFSNCSDGKSQAFIPPGQAPTPHPAPKLPATLTNAPLWLQQDRAYQLAAAQFYALDLDHAAAGFHAIAQDTASPWSTTARYVEARAYIRKAAFIPQPTDNGSGTPLTQDQHRAHEADFQQQVQQAASQRKAALQQAQTILLDAGRDPRMTPMRPAISALLDYVDARRDPARQTITLAQRVLTPNQPRLQQTLIDFTVLHNVPETFDGITLRQQQLTDRKSLLNAAASDPYTHAAADLAAWIDDLNGPVDATGSTPPPAPGSPAAKDALARWHTTPTTPWLVAAILFAQPTDPDAPALIVAAKSIALTDPAWLTVTYHRLRLTPHDPTTRYELLTLLPQIRRSEGPSAVNLFTALLAPTAPTLADWLPTTPRAPAGETSDMDGDSTFAQPKEDVCGRPIKAPLQLFDTDAAVAFNRQLPLRLLAASAESTALPDNLRYQVAQAALVRAILLDQPSIANRMAPILDACRAAWKPVLTAYAAAASKSPTDRHAAGLFALMRFASTEPSIREGEERRQGFASYDELRQNWWCSTVPLPTETVDNEPSAWHPNADPDAVRGSDPAWMKTHPHPVPPPPAFLTAADLAEADTEVTALTAVPNASSYFAHQALDWYKAHPTDPRTPELLGQADRVLRNACRHDAPWDGNTNGKATGETATLAHQLFDTLHQHFPNSPWTKRYKTWE